MVKHFQTIHQLLADKLFECVRPFWEVDTLRVKLVIYASKTNMNEIISGKRN